MSISRTKLLFFTIDYWPNNYGGMGIHLYNISHILSKWYDITVFFYEFGFRNKIYAIQKILGRRYRNYRISYNI